MYSIIKATQLSGKSPKAGFEGIIIEEQSRSAYKDEKLIPIKQEDQKLPKNSEQNRIIQREREMRERKREIEIEEKCRMRNSCICECFVLLFVSRESEIDSEE